MTEPQQLADKDLMDRARHWRRMALQGDPNARGHAHEHEAELRRRFAGGTTIGAPLLTERAKPKVRPFWRAWLRKP